MSADTFTVVERTGFLDVYFEVPVARTRTIVSYLTGGDGVTRRYLMAPGFRKYRGMYRNRRRVGSQPSTWTNDRAQAFLFTSPSAARKHVVREFGAASAKRYLIEAVKVTAVEHVVMYAANEDRSSTRRHLSSVHIA